MKNNQPQKNTQNVWYLTPVSDIFEFVKTYAFSRDNLNTEILSSNKVGSIHYGDIHSTYTGTTVDISKTKIPCIKDTEFLPKKDELLKDGDLVMADASEDYDGIGVTVSIHGIGKNKVVGGLHTFVLRDKNNITTEYYRQYIFRNKEIRNKLQKVANGVSVYGISKTALSKMLLPIPAISEQNRIVSVLETWDKAIKNLNKKIEIKKQIKKGLMQDLLTGKKRLAGFKDKWETKEIGELLDYEQPNKYIVNNTDYNDIHKTPVLTANKAFILGYTNETEGIYKSHPVIIFDDFTMDNKFVDFDFKVKSSAIKILTPKDKNVNLKFIFERIQLIKIIIGQHRRHYLSEYQYITMDTPNIKEQDAIAEIFTSADKEISELESKLKIIKDQKKYLLNNLITGAIRTPENMQLYEKNVRFRT